MNRRFCLLVLIAGGLLGVAKAQSPPPPQPVPVIDGGLGRCSLDLTITDDFPQAQAIVIISAVPEAP